MHPHPRQNNTFTGLSGGYEGLFAAPHRFSFNGMEKDDEVKGLGNSLDFGARMYDPRLGRWLSMDPHNEKYPWLSPYLSFANNPIIVVDIKGRDNIIYLVVLSSTEGVLTKAQIDDIVAQANQNFKDMGLKTEVRIADPSTFDITKMDETDAVAVLGNKKGVINFIDKKLDKSFSTYLSKEWEGGENNPEISENEDGDPSGNIIAIDVNGIEGFATKLGLNDEANPTVKAGALIINHGAGHNSGADHLEDDFGNTSSIIMGGASKLSSFLSDNNSEYPKYEFIVSNGPLSYKTNENHGRNEDYVSKMKSRFGDRAPKEKANTK